MHTIEFLANVQNGRIEIPTEYREQLKQVVRVIILSETGDSSENLIDQLLENPIQLPHFQPLSRGDIYARTT